MLPQQLPFITMSSSFRWFFGYSSDPVEADLGSIWKALSFAKAQGWNSICVQSDARNVILALNDGLSLPWKYNVWVDKIQNLKSSFASVNFLFIPRTVNQAAHLLAQKAKSFL
ncbi:PREDICTED: uncharacterized protein LOC104597410 [Nelumbo nucifera]|uniref:Uncharacterized protein LOC104597410 n=1 Tax=Nelumbo nucifera TaxID=4432 RepID=A0A1U7ZUD9_NELNU|nr:PREDICTED: uncharacterized protein LOC104597410 [Nelumbo nucifera]